MNRPEKMYESRDVAFIIPTKDRPEKVENLLDSLARQTSMCGRIIIVDGGRSVKNTVMSFSGRLPVEYCRCLPPGQIRQRNMGISRLNNSDRLVGFLDDDMVLEPDALEKMVDFWNRVDVDTAGVGFNVTDAGDELSSMPVSLFPGRFSVPGRVLSSGANLPIQNITEDISTQWLGGGYTVWRREILQNFPQDNLNTRWAIGEDVRYSYPIGKKYPLFVCAGARARHEHVHDQAPDKSIHRYQGLKKSLASFYCVELHPELSRAACLGRLIISGLFRLVYGSVTFDPQLLEFAMGQAEAIYICVKSIFGYADLRSELED